MKGDPVAAVPNRDCLVVTGSDDPEGLVAMAVIVTKLADEPRFMTGTPIVRGDDGWSVYAPLDHHPVRRVGQAAAREVQWPRMGLLRLGQGVTALLPKTTHVMLVDGHGTKLKCPWDAVRTVASDLMVFERTFPPRWRVEEFPSEEQLKDLATAGGAEAL